MANSRNNNPFFNKVVWITGASSGIGEALSYRFAALGASLILSSRREEALNKVNAQLPENPGSAKVLPLDLEDLEQLPLKTEEALSFYGRIDYFISNAGLAVKDYALNTDISIDQKLMHINYFGPIVITKKLLPGFMENKNGHIVVVSSLSGKYGVPRIAAYAASKHALLGFFETLRSETYNKGIKITIIIPGIINTEITAHALTGSGEIFNKVETTFKTAYPVDKAAKKIVDAILKEKEEVFVGGSEGFTLWLNRFSPWLLRRFIRNHPIKRMRTFKKFLGLQK
jgi:short-subunit dehydrogenase